MGADMTVTAVTAPLAAPTYSGYVRAQSSMQGSAAS